MTPRTTPDRRAVLGLLASATVLPTAVGADGFADFAARCQRLSGFDVLPLELVSALRGSMPENATDEALLTALYTGVVPERHADGNPKRVAYPDALMYAAIEDWANTPSFCGGLPGFWFFPPETV